MSPVRRFVASALCGLVLFGSAAVVAQDTAAEAKAEGKALGKTLGRSAGAIAKKGATEESLPNFKKGTPAEVDLYKDPDALEAKGEAAAAKSAAYQQMRTSMKTRAKFSKEELEAVVDRGLKIQDDPNALVKSPSEGSTGECRPIPPGKESPGWSEATCNSGFKAEEKTEQCAPVLRPRVTKTIVTANRYECSPINAAFNGTDDCSAFDAPIASGQCEVTGHRPGKCLQMSSNGCVEPGEPVTKLNCSVTVPGAKLLGATQTEKVSVENVVDAASCAGLGTDQGCQAPVETCTDPAPQTRVIDGVAVTASCWGWSKTWQCRVLTPAQDCTALEKRGCTFARQECLTSEEPCLTWDRVYNCPLPAEPTGEKQFVCDGDIYCIGGECETVERTPNAEFGEAVMALNGIADAAAQFDPNALTIFKGTRNTCTKTIFGIANCCAPRGFPIIASCDKEDKLLKKRRDEGVCHYVGSYCSKEVLGICLQKKEAHCCYGSKLARIIQEQGRPQLGLNWGKPKTAKCEGFTVDQFSKLDLSKIDFSEVLAEFVEAAKLPSDLETAKDLQTRIANYYATRK